MIYPHQLRTIPEAAREAFVPERDLRRAVNGGEIPCLRWSERKRYVLLGDVAAWQVAREDSCR